MSYFVLIFLFAVLFNKIARFQTLSGQLHFTLKSPQPNHGHPYPEIPQPTSAQQIIPKQFPQGFSEW
jgi:hypothetical protein